MKRIIQLMIYLSFVSVIDSSYANAQQKEFEGEWCCHTKCEGLDFRIHLHQDGDHLTGYHSGVTKDGSKTDTAPDGEGEPSINGRIKGDTATVDVHSVYSDAVVTVRLALHGRNLEWKMVEVKKRGEYYFPDKATLGGCH
jgi:hypothetical protein